MNLLKNLHSQSYFKGPSAKREVYTNYKLGISRCHPTVLMFLADKDYITLEALDIHIMLMESRCLYGDLKYPNSEHQELPNIHVDALPNWHKGHPLTQVCDSLYRHTMKLAQGEVFDTSDSETAQGYLLTTHLASAAWNLHVWLYNVLSELDTVRDTPYRLLNPNSGIYCDGNIFWDDLDFDIERHRRFGLLRGVFALMDFNIYRVENRRYLLDVLAQIINLHSMEYSLGNYADLPLIPEDTSILGINLSPDIETE